MRNKRDYSNLTVEEQIKKLKNRINVLKIFGLVWSIFIIVSSILLWTLASEWQLAIGFLIMLPLSIFLGGYLQIKECKQKIERIQNKII